MTKKILSLLLAALFIITAASAVFADGTSFSDVDPGAWYAGAVKAASEKGIMEGKGNGIFDPGGNVTRAEFATVLMRISGDTETSGEATFSDVSASDWFYPYVIWASVKGVANGYPDGTFRPGARILRSEMASMLARYIKISGCRIADDPDAVSAFPDVPGDAWYAGDLELLRTTGLLKGDAAGRFSPSSTATRAEAATLFVRFSDMLGTDVPTDTLLGVVRLETETGRDVESKEVYIKTSFSLTAPDGRDISYDEISIRGRGQASWGHEKKPYKLKFPEKVCLMDGSGTGTQAKDWTLIPCHSDKSLIRNYLAFKLASKLDPIEWTPYGELVHVYLNGEYRGVYLLSEHVEVAKGRVDIKDGTKDNIGFLVEYDSWATGEYNSDMFSVSGIKYSVQSDFRDKDQVIAMKCHLETVFNTVKEGDRDKVEQLVDLDSAVDIYLLNEVYRNNDVDWSSFFMYFKEPQGKLYFGPVWDLNLAFGNSSEQTSTSGLAVGHIISTTGKYKGDRNVWLAAFLSNEWFRRMAADRWEEIKETLRSTASAELAFVRSRIDELERNFEVWDILNTALGQEPEATLSCNSCLENVEYVENWLNSRIDWLDGYYSTDAFISGYPADRTKVDPGPIGNTEPVGSHDAWVIPDWFEGDSQVQLYVDNIEEYCGITRGRIEVRLGGYSTMTAKNVTRVVIGEQMGLNTDRYEMFFDEDEFEAARESYQGLGGGQSTIFELKTGIRDLVTGEESTLMKVKYTFVKDLSLNDKFGE
ncbi:MAG: CotH kinase family protein [Clostridia bacterium]|nr:CotH kinase family protein [Clostridia bacterium]